MYRKLCLISLILVFVLVAQAQALYVNDTQTWGPTRIENLSGGGLEIGPAGNLTITGRVDMDEGAWIRMSGGILTTTNTLKFPDSDGDQNVRMYINSGTFTAHDIENRGYDRNGIIFVGGGTLIVQTGYNTGNREYDPLKWLQDNTIRPAEGYEQLIFTPLGGEAVKITTTSPKPEISFNSQASADLESVSPAVLEVVLKNGQAGETYTVDYAVTGGTATGCGVDYYSLFTPCDMNDLQAFADNWLWTGAGFNRSDFIVDGIVAMDDYSMLAVQWLKEKGTLVFEPGQTSKTIDINIMNDDLDEEDETIVVQLLNPVGPDVELVDPNEHVYTIRDPRPAVAFALETGPSTTEDSGPIVISICLSAPSDETVAVDYCICGGTATNGEDYYFTCGTLTFNPGETCKDISIPLVEDDLVEDEETIVLELSNPVHAKLGAITQHTAKIRDPWASGAYEVFKVDLACPGNASTAKEGWVAFEGDGWCDGQRHDGRGISNIADTGIDAYIDNVPQNGSVNLKTTGGEPICNTAFMEITGDVFGPPDCSIIIRLSGTGLEPGEYWLYAFHNWPGSNLIPSVTASGTGVTQVEPVTNVPIQNTQVDDELVPSLVKFYTDGSGPVTVTYEAAGGQKAVVNAFALFSTKPPEYATDPSPRHGATDVMPDVILSWTAGTGAEVHDVYLGTSFADVNSGAWEVYMTTQAETTYVPLSLLEFGQTYYWKIDEVNENIPRIVHGKVWQFTVADGKASNPSPRHGSGSNPLDVTLSWTPGAMASSHDVYFGTDETAVANATPASDEYKGNKTETTYTPDTLLEATIYYWRIDEHSHTTVQGDVWRFSTVGMLDLKVDLGLPVWGGSEPIAGTVKEGWWGYVASRWADMYMHDAVWERGEDGQGGVSPDTDGIDGSGVHVALDISNGNGGFHVYGMCRGSLGGDLPPTGSPVGDPIANGWYHNIDWGGECTGDIHMRINDLPAGRYRLTSYHNHWEPQSQSTRNCLTKISGMPPMQHVYATSIPLEGTMTCEYILGWGTGTGVVSITEAYNIDVTSTTSDAEVATSVIVFETDGSDVLVIYDGGDNTYPDPARPDREGHKAILNAFELESISP